MAEPSHHESSKPRRLVRLLVVSLTFLSLVLAFVTTVLWLRLRNGEFWNDLFLVSHSGHCVMIRSSRTLPYSEELFTVLYESPWPIDVPFSWWDGDAMVKRHIGPARVGQVTIHRVMDAGGIKVTRWEGFKLGFWSDGAPVFDASGYNATSYSAPMNGLSFSMPHTYWILLFLFPPLAHAYARIRRPATPKRRTCPECTCDIPKGATKCPDCGLALELPMIESKSAHAPPLAPKKNAAL